MMRDFWPRRSQNLAEGRPFFSSNSALKPIMVRARRKCQGLGARLVRTLIARPRDRSSPPTSRRRSSARCWVDGMARVEGKSVEPKA